MTVFVHEWKRGKTAFLIWTSVIAGMILMCMCLYPEMKNQMEEVNEMFANMGSFTAAFGMDQVSFGEIMGFYAVECGNILGLGGAFFAAILGIQALSKEEKERTAEFLLTHPISRESVILQKWMAALTEILMMNGMIFGISAASFVVIGEEMQMKEMVLIHLAFLILQEEIMSICFGISAFLRSSGLGIGIGIATLFYFLNMIANLSEQAEFLCYMTPFSYGDAADILANGAIEMKFLLPGLFFLAAGVAAAFLYYTRKDIHA